MKNRLIKKSEILTVVDKLASAKALFAPAMNDGNILFKRIAKSEELSKEYVNSKNAPKGFFFPHTELMMRYARTDKGMAMSEVVVDAQERVLFNVRPCDARSFLLLDKLFIQEKYRDEFYASKREKTTAIVNACVNPSSKSCFCTSVGGSPTAIDGADVIMLDIGDSYLVKFITPKGDALADFFGGVDADDAAENKANEVVAKAQQAVDASIPAKDIKTILDNNFANQFWDALPQRCLACGTCTYLCPTCHCFDISDETKGDDGERIRNWDSCMFPLFTKETSGHNPRGTQKDRWRQRVMHKFKYFVDNFEAIGCVGCGRCVSYCPVNMDIRKIVKDISKI